MVSRPAAFTQSDVTRAAKGLAAAGIKVIACEVTPEGVIRVFGEDGTTPPTLNPTNSWDDLDEA